MVADFNFLQFTGDTQGAIRVVAHFEAGAADTNGGGGGGEFVVVAVAFANQASDGPHTAAQQINQKTVLFRIVLVDIVGDFEFGIGLQGNQSAVGKFDLGTAVVAGHDGVPAVDFATFGQCRDTAVGLAQVDLTSGELRYARRGVNLKWVNRSQRYEQRGVFQGQIWFHVMALPENSIDDIQMMAWKATGETACSKNPCVL